jgi:hypothetical protein
LLGLLLHQVKERPAMPTRSGRLRHGERQLRPTLIRAGELAKIAVQGMVRRDRHRDRLSMEAECDQETLARLVVGDLVRVQVFHPHLRTRVPTGRRGYPVTRTTFRTLSGLAVALLAAGSPAVAARPDKAPASPHITSVYAKDEGALVVLRVNYRNTKADLNDPFSIVFKVWNHNRTILDWTRRVSGRAPWRSVQASYRVEDFIVGFGDHWVDVTVLDRSTGHTAKVIGKFLYVS